MWYGVSFQQQPLLLRPCHGLQSDSESTVGRGPCNIGSKPEARVLDSKIEPLNSSATQRAHEAGAVDHISSCSAAESAPSRLRSARRKAPRRKSFPASVSSTTYMTREDNSISTEWPPGRAGTADLEQGIVIVTIPGCGVKVQLA